MTSASVIAVVISAATGSIFSEIYYRETVLGEIEWAHQQYTQLYLGRPEGGEPTRRRRRRAAFRAGVCAEKLGDPERARSAYRWLVENGSTESGADEEGAGADAFVAKARDRLRALGADPAPADGAGDSSDSSTAGDADDSEATPETGGGGESTVSPLPADFAGAVRAALERSLAERLAARDRSAEQLEALRRAAATRGRLESRLRRVGVELYWPRDGESARTQAIEDELAALGLDESDLVRLRERLIERLFLEGVKSLRARELSRAMRAFRRQIGLAARLPEEPVSVTQARDFVASLERVLAMSEGLARSAARLLPMAVESDEALAASRMRGLVADAGEQSRRGQRESALELIETSASIEDWAPAGAHADGRLREISLQAERRRRALLPDFVEPELEARHARAAREVQDSATELAIARLDTRSPAAGVDGARAGGASEGEIARPRLVDRARMLPRLRREVRELLDALDRPPEAPASDDTARELESRARSELRQRVADTATLFAWFPELDADGAIARRLERFLRSP